MGFKIGEKLRGGEVFLLKGDLGFGKTNFVKGVVAGVGIKDEVTSPSFTITNVYKGNKLNIHHIDFYRLPDAGLMKHEIQEIIQDNSNIIFIEWPGVIEEHLPKGYIDILISDMGDTVRQFEIKYPKEKDYVLAGIKK